VTLPTAVVEAAEAGMRRGGAEAWRRLVGALDAMDALSPGDAQLLRRLVATWPREVPREPPAAWVEAARRGGTRARALLRLCLHVDEVDTYPLYETALGADPRLQRPDSGSACVVWRQPRGTVTLADGSTMTFGGGQEGLADLGLRLLVAPRPGLVVPVYGEVEVKIDGKIPPGAAEYVGTSRRQLDPTEAAQVARQKASTSQGGLYVFADRVADAVDAVVAYRDELLRRLA